VLDVEEWADLRRRHFVGGVSIKELARRGGLARNTVRAALRSEGQPRYARASAPSKLDPFKDEIHRLLGDEPKLPATRVRELIEPLGFEGRQTIVDVYVREVRPLFSPLRTFQRTTYRPGEIAQFDLLEPRREIPVGFGQTRKGYVLACVLGYSRASAGALIFSKSAEDILAGLTRCLWRLGGLPQTLVTDREAALHAGSGRPSEPFARFCGELRCGWSICAARDAQAKGMIEAVNGHLRSNFEPGRSFASPLDFQEQLDRWFERRGERTHRTLRARPIDRLAGEGLRALPERALETDRRWVLRVPPDPHVRVDRNDYSLDPGLVGRRVEVRVSQEEISALALDTGALAARHSRSFAAGRTFTALEHARTLRERRGARPEPEVEVRPLERYDALISA
jgi:transposase